MEGEKEEETEGEAKEVCEKEEKPKEGYYKKEETAEEAGETAEKPEAESEKQE